MSDLLCSATFVILQLLHLSAMNGSDSLPTFDDFCSNASTNSTHEYFWTLDGHGLATACFLLLLFIVGFPLNCVVAIVILWNKLYEQPTHVLLFSLILSDSIMLLTIVPQGVITGFAGEYIFGSSDHVRCQFCHIGVIFTWFTLMSLFTIGLMSLDRFLFIYMPLRYEKIITSMRTAIVLVFVWVFCTVVAILPLIGFGKIAYFRAFASCTVNYAASDNYYLVVLLVSACVPLAVITVCNGWVVHIVLKNIKVIYKVRRSLVTMRQRRSYSVNLRKVVKKKKQRKQVHLMRVFGSLFCASLVAWLPTIMLTLASFALPFDSIPKAFDLISYFLLLSQVVSHPALETALISAVKEPIKEFIKRMLSQLKRFLHCSCGICRTSEGKNEDISNYCGCDALYVFYAALLPQEIDPQNSETTASAEEIIASDLLSIASQ